ncbi:MAG: hypothetical protein WC848_06385 [Parcubacteria group bacterium]|jgi:hypothetical protein
MKIIGLKLVVVLVSLVALAGISTYVTKGYQLPNIFGGDNNSHEDTNGHDDGNNNNGNDKKETKVDFRISSQCHYYNYDPQNSVAFSGGDLAGYVDVGCFSDGQAFGSWQETGTNHLNKFFNFDNIKPGDRGEDAISFHILGDDGCGQITFENIKDDGNDCTDSETQSSDQDCKNRTPGTREKRGELGKALQFSLWLDQGRTPGFQGKTDPGEGDNIFNEKDVLISDWKDIREFSTALEIRKCLRQARNKFFDLCKSADPNGSGRNTKKGVCAGLSTDGRMVDGTVYYYGLAWRLPGETGNEIQSDSLGFDMAFQVKSNSQCSVCQGKDYDHNARCDD